MLPHRPTSATTLPPPSALPNPADHSGLSGPTEGQVTARKSQGMGTSMQKYTCTLYIMQEHHLYHNTEGEGIQQALF